jgi:hypothetical protein
MATRLHVPSCIRCTADGAVLELYVVSVSTFDAIIYRFNIQLAMCLNNPLPSYAFFIRSALIIILCLLSNKVTKTKAIYNNKILY